MKHLAIFSLTIILATHTHAKMLVHEWGTFTSLVGSNGKAQNGMYYEDEQLPDFVHNFGESIAPSPSQGNELLAWAPRQPEPTPTPAPPRPPDCPRHGKIPCEFLFNQTITQKMETPVVYFYSDQPQKVSFDVGFPGGIISQSYPAPLKSLPAAVPGVELKNGFAHYELSILKESNLAPPSVDSSNIYSHARNVASDLIQSGSEIEKFIFYRGLGEFKTKLQSTSRSGNLKLFNSGADTIPEVFVISTDGSKNGGLISLGNIPANNTIVINAQTIQSLKSSKLSYEIFLKSARSQLQKALTSAGLYADEAKAMIDTWEHGYFKTPGLRILYVLGKHEVESILPVKITPVPEELNRVFVGRIEVLLDSDEDEILTQILKDGSNYDVSRLGRMAHPTLLRIREVAQTKELLTSDLAATIDELMLQIQ